MIGKDTIRIKAHELGFDVIGFTHAQLPEKTGHDLDTYLEKGHHGDMDWLAGKANRRRTPAALWPEAKSVIVLGVNFLSI
mgnify:CR=1 FL=1